MADGGTGLIERLSGAHLLLVAPHPDDESLAMGGLIQHAVRAQARVTIVQVTDGDNNPWPQRWLERRLRIGEADRQRWGRRRASEMLEAMRQLGLGASSRQRLGWPDMGVTRHLQAAGIGAIERMAAVLRDAAPDIVALPSLGDQHPDHGSCHVLTRLAMAHTAFDGTVLTYQVHGKRPSPGHPVSLPLDADMRDGKRRAIMAHHTQVAMARKRLLAYAGAGETLHDMPHAPYASGMPESMLLPWHPPRVLHPWLELTLAHPDGVHVWRWNDAPLVPHQEGIHLTLPASAGRGPLFARLKVRCRSPWIFDHWGWRDLTVTTAARQAGD